MGALSLNLFEYGNCMSSHALELKIPPVVVVAVVMAFMWLTARATPTLLVLFPGRLVLSLLIVALGVAIIAAGVHSFSKANTTVNPHRPSASTFVVTTGIYRITRNPMYLGMLLLILAWMVYLANVTAAIFPILFVAYITRFQIQPEERVLIEKFGSAYEAYRASVRRWL
jgi:protein-S-isoprenylcysteine O-methyltransferase Ste14